MKIPQWLLEQRQGLSLAQKVELSKIKIKEWYEHWDSQVYLAFSGGKDSTVVKHLIETMYNDVPFVFNDTGLEYPEVRDFVKSCGSATFLKPRRTFKEVIQKFGYPVAYKEVAQKIYEVRTTNSAKLRSKRLHGDNNKYRSGKIPDKWMFLIDAPFPVSHHCCNVLKKYPANAYERKTGRKVILGTMALDSQFRKQSYVQHGCAAYNSKRPRLMPIAFWTNDDIWEYIRQSNVPYSRIYDMGVENTGCMFCAFGVHKEEHPNKFQRMKITHPKLWRYCMDNLSMREVLDYISVSYE